MVWLHGRLELHIKEGVHLPGEQIGMCRNSLGRMLEGCIAKAHPAYVMRAASLTGTNTLSRDCYAVLNIVTKYQVSKSRFRTSIICSHNPTYAGVHTCQRSTQPTRQVGRARHCGRC